MSVTVRRAIPEDVPFLVGIVTDEDVAPFLASVRATTEEEVAAEVAGTATWERINRRSQIASVGAFALDAPFRGRGLGDEAARVLQRHLIRELDLHRLQLEIYAFNERALRHAERAGWVREGVRRKAYRRDDEWVDAILFGLVAEDLET